MLGKESNPLSDMCTIYGLTNIVKKPTCFKANKGTLLDVILVNKKSLFFDTSVIINAINDFHALTSTRMRGHVPRMQNKFIEYRSQKHYNKALFLESVADSNLRFCLTLEDPEHGWRLFTDNFKTTIDHHAPIQKRKIRSNQPPYINTSLHKAICKRKCLYKKYIANRNGDTWEKYRAQRNLCVDMRRKAMRGYLFHRTKQNKGIF